jgi:signal peptidase I
MTSENANENEKIRPKFTEGLAEAVGIFEWLMIALILALFFRAFIMEAYRIPTGSMAETLNGAHFRLCCSQCGYRFDRGYDPAEYGLGTDALPLGGKAKPLRCRCPSCGYDLEYSKPLLIADGDRILVLKCLYQFQRPKRWDVIVFKDPQDPTTNLIKRLVAKPGESIEIIDGDIYIDGLIARKPASVQDELWMTVYNNNYHPIDANKSSFNGHSWSQPFRNDQGSTWRSNEGDQTTFILDGNGIETNWLVYDASIGNDFRAYCAYNKASEHDRRPYCSDLMVNFSTSCRRDSKVGAELSKYGTRYQAWVDKDSRMVIGLADVNDKVRELTARQLETCGSEMPISFSFANVDHLLIFELGKDILTFDLGRESDALGPRNTDIQPGVKIFGIGSIELSNLAIFRDIHYTVRGFAGTDIPARAAEGDAFALEKDEFFVLGDNSTNSYDCRWWKRQGIGNNDITYRAGVVPHDYLVGKAVFVYWPSGYQPFDNWPAIVPNVGRVRFIYGGSNER